MNLKHGFDSNNALYNPDMQLLQRSGRPVFANTIKHLMQTPSSNVGTLYSMRTAGAHQKELEQPLNVYFDRLMSEAKTLPNISNDDLQAITYFCDAVFLIQKLDMPTNTPLSNIHFDADEPNHDRRLLGQAMRKVREAMQIGIEQSS